MEREREIEAVEPTDPSSPFLLQMPVARIEIVMRKVLHVPWLSIDPPNGSVAVVMEVGASFPHTKIAIRTHRRRRETTTSTTLVFQVCSL